MESNRVADGLLRRTVLDLGEHGLVEESVVTINFRKDRPGAGWYAHGTTRKEVFVLVGRVPCKILLIKQRWLNTRTGETRHDRPVWDRPGCPYAMDVVLAVLLVWLDATVALRDLRWRWDDLRPDPRTARRWAAHLRPHAHSWLQASRTYFIDLVSPRPLDDVLPAAGIPPPRGRRCRSQEVVAHAGKLSDVIWLHEKVAHALSISLRTLLEGAGWRWPLNPRQSPRF